MGAGEAIALLGLCALGIAFCAMTFSLYSRRLAFKQRKLELELEGKVLAAGGNLERVAELEQRVRVLERIATDRGHDIAHQIEALRDASRVAALLEAQDAEVR